MKKGGKGGNRTKTGLDFECRKSLEQAFAVVDGYSVKDLEVHFRGIKVAKLYPKHKLYKSLLEPRGVDYEKLISKKLLPDEALLNIKHNTLFIIEMKFQEVAGSVDEKLQTCDFKNKQYQKLLKPLHIKVKYVYLLSEWFAKPEYGDVLKYVKSVGCYCFFDKLPLSFLRLPEPNTGN